MVKEIRMEEGKLKVIFEIRDNGVVELKQFDPAGRADVRERKREAEDFYPITEVQMTGRGSRGMHAYKHNVSGGATDFTYQSHEILENEKGKTVIVNSNSSTAYWVYDGTQKQLDKTIMLDNKNNGVEFKTKIKPEGKDYYNAFSIRCIKE